jgi:hypothetical protein
VTTFPERTFVVSLCAAGTVITGACVSTTVTLNRLVVVLPSERAEHVTAVVPNPKIEPDGGVHVTGIGRPRSSTADAVYVTVAPLKFWASTVMSAGTVTTGGSAKAASGRFALDKRGCPV